MIREIKKDRAGVIPYVLYFIYTVYMVVAAVYLKWPSWVAAVIICGLLASIGRSDADRTVQQTGEVILFCYDMDEYYFIYGIHGRFVSYHGNSSSKCCDVVSF